MKAAAKGAAWLVAAHIALYVPCVSIVAAAPPARADSARVEDAVERFHRGVALYEEGDTAGALAELKRAYDMAPNFKILYNLGQISYQARDYVAALDYFKRYLYEGGWRVPDNRRREVEAEIQTLQQRTGHVDVQVPEAGVAIRVDEGPAEMTPLAAPLLMSVGRHRIEATWPSGQRELRFVDVAGGDALSLSFETKGAIGVPRLSLAAAEKAIPNSEEASAQGAENGGGRGDRASEDATPSPATRLRPAAWVSWSITGALAVGAAVTGGLAWQKSGQAGDALSAFPTSRSEVDDLRSEQRKWAWASDGLLLSTLVMAGVSLYLTRSSGPENASTTPHSQSVATASH